jgi:hypothetical protein
VVNQNKIWTQVKVWCSGRVDYAWERGRGFESHRPRSMRILCEKCHDLQLRWRRAGAGGWGPPLVKIFFFTIFFFFWFPTLPLPSAWQKALGKDGFANTFFTEWNLQSVTLGKGFAEYNCGFAGYFHIYDLIEHRI